MVVQAIMIPRSGARTSKPRPKREAGIMAMNPDEAIEDWLLLKQSLVVLTIVMIAFVLARPLHLEPRPSPWAAPQC